MFIVTVIKEVCSRSRHANAEIRKPTVGGEGERGHDVNNGVTAELSTRQLPVCTLDYYIIVLSRIKHRDIARRRTTLPNTQQFFNTSPSSGFAYCGEVLLLRARVYMYVWRRSRKPVRARVLCDERSFFVVRAVRVCVHLHARAHAYTCIRAH